MSKAKTLALFALSTCWLTSGSTCGKIVKFQWPFEGDNGREWVVTAHFDHDATSTYSDYTGGLKTYDGHEAIDISVPTYRAMDDDFQVLAAAAGEVVAIQDGYFDRNLMRPANCSSDVNFIELEHVDGTRTKYKHVKMNSITHSLGDKVIAGEAIAVVGGSGCATGPHLHFELKKPTRGGGFTKIDPFAEGRWIDPPDYNAPLGIMDVVLIDGGIGNSNQIKDPAPNLTIISEDSRIGVGLVVGGPSYGDHYRIVISAEDGSQMYDQRGGFRPGDFGASADGTKARRWTNWDILGPKGRLTLRVYAGDILAYNYSFDVE